MCVPLFFFCVFQAVHWSASKRIGKRNQSGWLKCCTLVPQTIQFASNKSLRLHVQSKRLQPQTLTAPTAQHTLNSRTQQHPPKCQSNLKFIYSLCSVLLCSAPFRLERHQVWMACTFSSHVSYVKHSHHHHYHVLLLLPLHLTHKSRLSSCTQCELFKYIYSDDDHCEFSAFIHLPAL